MSPRVTVLVAVYNGGAHLAEAVASVLAQTYTAFELLLVDDASDDGAIAALPDDPRIRILRNDANLGQIPSLNRGLHEARGELVARLDHDDLCLPQRFERQVDLFDRMPQLALCATWVDVVDDDGRLWTRARPRVDSYEQFAADVVTARLRLAHPSVMFRRDAVLAVGGFDESLGAAEDQELYRRLALARREVRVLPETLLQYRRHAGQMTVERAGMVEDNDARSHERFLAAVAPESPAHALRLLFREDPAYWDGDALAVEELEAFVTAAADRLGVARDVLTRAVADTIVRAIVAGWAGGSRVERGDGLRAFALRHGAGTRMLPLLRVAGPFGQSVAAARRGAGRALRSGVLDMPRRLARRSRALRWLYARIVAR